MTQSALQQTTNRPIDERAAVRDTIVVAGEFEVGKSSVVNAILRRPLLPNNPGFLSRPLVRIRHRSTTLFVAELTDGTSYKVGSLEDIVEREDVATVAIHTPLPGLEAVEVVEIPFHPKHGIDLEHAELMREANLLVWVTIASQAWRLSEKSIVQTLPEGLAERLVLAVSRADKLRTQEDLEKIETRLYREATDFFNDIVFMHASARRLDACVGEDDVWQETGGQALVEIARRAIGDMSVSDSELLSAFDAPKFGRRATDRVGVTLSDVVPVARPLMEHAEKPVIENAVSEPETATIPEEATTVATFEVPTVATVSDEPETDTEVAASPPIFQARRKLLRAAPTGNRTRPAPAPAKPRMPIFDADTEKELDDALDELVLSVEAEESAAVETVEPEPAPVVIETPAEKIERATNNITGLKTAAIVDLSTHELQTCFAEKEIKAERCLHVLSNVVDTDIRMMRLLGDDTFRETTITVGDHLVLLQMIEGHDDLFAFFILQRGKANPAVSSVRAKRLLDVWRDSLAD